MPKLVPASVRLSLAVDGILTLLEDVTDGASKEKKPTRVPAEFATVTADARVVAGWLMPKGAMAQAIVVKEDQLTVAQSVLMMRALAVKSPAPKLTPVMVTVALPERPALRLSKNETDGAS